MKLLVEKAKEEVGKLLFTSKQPLVEVTVNGNKEVVEVKILGEITKDDIEILQDMILLATNDAIQKADKAMQERLGNLSSGLAGLF